LLSQPERKEFLKRVYDRQRHIV
ncbi:unnamed protein product, partial [Oikopleura dioica]